MAFCNIFYIFGVVTEKIILTFSRGPDCNTEEDDNRQKKRR